jgi:hypothetical protein
MALIALPNVGRFCCLAWPQRCGARSDLAIISAATKRIIESWPANLANQKPERADTRAAFCSTARWLCANVSGKLSDEPQ